ncbi:unnamed protein product, partial [Ectocarpus fasciculatus]
DRTPDLSHVSAAAALGVYQDVDDVFRKYDPKGTGKLDVHSFVVRLISPTAEPEPWFSNKDTYEFH